MKVLYLLTFMVLVSCLSPLDKGEIEVTLDLKKKERPKVSSVQLVDDEIVINGKHFLRLDTVKLNSQNLDVISNTATKIVLSSSSAFTLALGTALDLIVTTAHGAAAVPVIFNLVDGSVTASKLSDMGASTGQFLKYNGTTWVPTTISSGLTYLGGYDASTNTPNASLGGYSNGEYYIVSVAGTQDLGYGNGSISWNVGDWLVWNGVDFDQINNTVGVTSVNGSSGVITKAEIFSGSALNDIADVDTTGISAGKILKWDGSKWAISDDLSSGGAGSVSTTEINDGTILDADISASAAIAQSKISGLTTLATQVGTNTSGVSTNATDISTNQTDIATNATSISTNASNISTNATAIAAKQDAISDGTSGQYLTTDGAGNYSFSSLPAVGDSETLSTSCADGKILKASGGGWTCADDIDTTNAGDFLADGSVPLTGDLDVGNNKLRLKSNNTNYVELKSPDGLGATYSLIFPGDDGSTGQVLTTNGSGTLSWTTPTTASGDITDVVAGTGLTGGASTGSATLNIDVGTTSGKIVQLDGSARLPGVDGSQLTNLPNPTSSTVLSGFVTGADSTVLNTDTVEVAVEKLQGQVNGNNSEISTNATGISTNATAIAGKEPSLTAGTTGQYYRGDKTWQTLDNAAVGLTNVDDVQQMPLSYLDTDSSLTADSDALVASQKAVKTYVDAAVAGSGSGDFLADGSVPMTGDFDLGTQKLVNGSGINLKGDASVTLTGTVEVSGTSLIGTGTAFTTELSVGDLIQVATSVLEVTAIGSDATATLGDSVVLAAGQALTKLNSILEYKLSDDSSALALLSNGNVGIGTTATQANLHVYDETITPISSKSRLAYFHQLINSPSDSGSTFLTNHSFAETDPGNTSNYNDVIIALASAVFHNGSGTVNEQRGVNGSSRNKGTGSILLAKGGEFTAANDAAGDITDAIAAQLVGSNSGTMTNYFGSRLNFSNVGTIDNTYGSYIGDITSGTQTNTPFSFYAADPNAYNYFAGNVGIGTPSPTQMLDVNGNVKATSFIGDGSGLTNIATAVTGNINLNGDTSKVVSMDRHSTSDTAGSNLTVNAGGATSGATDKSGGDLVLSSGTSTGTGSSKIEFKTSEASGTGTSDNAPSTAMTILGNGNVGIGTINPVNKLHIEDIITDPTPDNANKEGNNLYVSTVADPTAQLASDYYASIHSQMNSETTNNKDMMFLLGIHSSSFHNGTGAISDMRALSGTVNNKGAGDINGAYGFYIESRNSGSGNVDKLIGGRISLYNSSTGSVNKEYGLMVNSNNTSTVNDTYGVHIGDLSSGTRTNQPFALYSSDSNARSYFAGNVGIGTTAPTSKLHVNGRILASSIKMEWTDKTNTNNGDVLTTSDNIFLDATTAAFGLALPAAPDDGDEIRFVHSAGSLATNNVTLTAGAGDTIVGDPTLVLDLDNISIELIFYDVDGDGNGDWRLK